MVKQNTFVTISTPCKVRKRGHGPYEHNIHSFEQYKYDFPQKKTGQTIIKYP